MTCELYHQQVVVTVYEVICHGREGGRVVRWATWAKVLKELSQVLLVAYSALNPIAYCGDLVYRLACIHGRGWAPNRNRGTSTTNKILCFYVELILTLT